MAMTKETDEIARLCKSYAFFRDKSIFEKYVRHEIELSECIEKFRKNNHVKKKIDIDPDAFSKWLVELKYERS